MKVKNYIWGAFVALATLAGCDEVDEQDRFISMGDVEVKRNVLLEDFTGQDCSNCPTAHEVVASLKGAIWRCCRGCGCTCNKCFWNSGGGSERRVDVTGWQCLFVAMGQS